MKPHLELAHEYWQKVVRPKDTVIDATLGNGHDTFFLAKLLKGEGKLIGYDIQQKALENTELRLQELSEKEKKIIFLNHLSHENFLEPFADLIVYNLGYLPGGNKAITTLTETTLKSVQMALSISKKAISITCYPGHSEGKKEENALLAFFESYSHPKWNICIHKWTYRPLSPSLIWLESTPKKKLL